MKSSIKSLLHIAALLMALVGGAWLLMADSDECSGDDNEELCDKCGGRYTINETLCRQCSDHVCFGVCLKSEDTAACATSYKLCEEETPEEDCVLAAMCEGAENEELCLGCGSLLNDETLTLCKTCADDTCRDICKDAASGSDCATSYNECLEETSDPEACRSVDTGS